MPACTRCSQQQLQYVTKPAAMQEGSLTMPVPQPQVIAEWMSTVHEKRKEAMAMQDLAQGSRREAATLRKRFSYDERVMNGISLYLNRLANGIEDFMNKCLDFAFDPAATKTMEDLIKYFWNGRAATVLSHDFHLVHSCCQQFRSTDAAPQNLSACRTSRTT